MPNSSPSPSPEYSEQTSVLGGFFNPTILTANKVVGGSSVSITQTQGAGQSINLASGITTKGIGLQLKKFGSPVDGLVVELLTTSMAGSVIATATLSDVSILSSTEFKEYRLLFDAPVALSGSTVYYIRITRTPDNEDVTNYVLVGGAANGGTYTQGKFQYKYQNVWHEDNGDDIYFSLLVSSGSVSASPSLSLSSSPSASISASPSITPSVSISDTPSVSISASPSISISASISFTPSVSTSSSVSPSPSHGYSLYSRKQNATLPSNNADLDTLYTDQEVLDVESEDEVYVDQLGRNSYMIHQFKIFVGERPKCKVEWRGKTTLEPSTSIVYLQIYNQSTETWEILDSYSRATIDENFTLQSESPKLTNYKDSRSIVSFRVYQFSTP